MRRLSFGVILTIMYQARGPHVSNSELCDSVFNVFNGTVNNRDRAVASHLRNGTHNVPYEIVKKARLMTSQQIISGVTTMVIPKLDAQMHKKIFAAVRSVIEEDETLSMDTEIGFSEEYTKAKIVCKSQVDFPEFLAGVLTYSITKVRNTDTEKACKLIEKDFVKNMPDHPKLVFREKNKKRSGTLLDSNFTNIFESVNLDNTLSHDIPENVFYHAYIPQLSNGALRFYCAREILLTDICGYALQRHEFESYCRDRYSNTLLCMESLLRFSNYYHVNAEKTIGSFLLYIYLEKVISSPKIVGDVELWDSKNRSLPDIECVHFLPAFNSNGIRSEMIFGISEIHKDIEKGISLIFERLNRIVARRDCFMERGYQFLVSQEKSHPDFLKRVINSMNTIHETASMSFGIFFGYQITIEQRGNGDTWKEYVKQLVRDDAKKIIDSFSKYMKKYKLEGYKFYICILPFNDAEKEKQSIVNDILRKDFFYNELEMTES